MQNDKLNNFVPSNLLATENSSYLQYEPVVLELIINKLQTNDSLSSTLTFNSCSNSKLTINMSIRFSSYHLSI